MNKPYEILLNQVEQYRISTIKFVDCNELEFTMRNLKQCKAVWAEISTQVNDNTEGRIPIQYDIQEHIPEDKVLVIFGETDNLIQLLQFLETRFDDFIAQGTAEKISAHFYSAQLNSASTKTAQEIRDTSAGKILAQQNLFTNSNVSSDITTISEEKSNYSLN